METLPKPSHEYWWLIGLEATLAFSLPCWENTARWSWPAANPLQFTAFVISAATIAMLCCHIGPAMYAAKFGARPHVAWWIPAIWLSAGYLEGSELFGPSVRMYTSHTDSAGRLRSLSS